MTAPDKRRPLPALVAIAALTLLTALVWFRVLHRGTAATDASTSHQTSTKPCPTPSLATPTVLPKPQLVTLLVLNSTSRNGLAKGVKTLLVKDGFKVSQATNDGTAYGGHGLLPGVAEIRFGPSAKAAATLLSYYVPGATLVPTDSSATSVILSLGTKYKALATPASVSAALTTNHLTQSSASITPQPTPSKTC